MKKIVFGGDDGLRRSGYIHDQGARAVVVCCHGLFSWKGDEHSKFARLGRALASEGMTLVRFDCTGCGESEGQFRQSVLGQRIFDLETTLAYLESEGKLQPETPLFLIGSSFGGSVILCTAAQCSRRVNGLVTWSAPVDLLGYYRERYAHYFQKWQQGITVTVENDGRLYELGPEFLDSLEQIQPLSFLDKLVTVPLLIIHGGADEVVPLTQAHMLAGHYPGPHRLEVIPSGTHRLMEQYDLVESMTRAWLNEQLS
ncbi:alpha/beta fold hydrolase [bacterium]|nr:alpha/beta fold hydrolase [bacterium]